MAGFCVIEGVDGSGKSHLTAALGLEIVRAAHRNVVALLKDTPLATPDDWPTRRLRAIHRLTWSYDPSEPVWDYSRGYWLHTLAAWYSLFYEQRVRPALAAGQVAITDGWFFKHQARFRLSNDPRFIQLADMVLRSLPQPDLVLFMDTPMALIQERKANAKPSERGAFEASLNDKGVEGAGFADYQRQTRDALWQVLTDHPAYVHTVSETSSVRQLLALIAAQLDVQS